MDTSHDNITKMAEQCDPRDIVHSGELEGLSDYSVFRLRYPKRRAQAERLLDNWYLQEAPCRGGQHAICLVGQYKDTIIRTSVVVGIKSERQIVTANGLYVLGAESKVHEHELKNGLHMLFLDGFPSNWKELVRQAYDDSTTTKAMPPDGPKDINAMAVQNDNPSVETVGLKENASNASINNGINILKNAEEAVHVSDANVVLKESESVEKPTSVSDCSGSNNCHLSSLHSDAFEEMDTADQRTTDTDKLPRISSSSKSTIDLNLNDQFFINASIADTIDDGVHSMQDAACTSTADHIDSDAMQSGISLSKHDEEYISLPFIDSISQASINAEKNENAPIIGEPAKQDNGGCKSDGAPFMTVKEALKQTPFYKEALVTAGKKKINNSRKSSLQVPKKALSNQRRRNTFSGGSTKSETTRRGVSVDAFMDEMNDYVEQAVTEKSETAKKISMAPSTVENKLLVQGGDVKVLDSPVNDNKDVESNTQSSSKENDPLCILERANESTISNISSHGSKIINDLLLTSRIPSDRTQANSSDLYSESIEQAKETNNTTAINPEMLQFEGEQQNAECTQPATQMVYATKAIPSTPDEIKPDLTLLNSHMANIGKGSPNKQRRSISHSAEVETAGVQTPSNIMDPPISLCSPAVASPRASPLSIHKRSSKIDPEESVESIGNIHASMLSDNPKKDSPAADDQPDEPNTGTPSLNCGTKDERRPNKTKTFSLQAARGSSPTKKASLPSVSCEKEESSMPKPSCTLQSNEIHIGTLSATFIPALSSGDAVPLLGRKRPSINLPLSAHSSTSLEIHKKAKLSIPVDHPCPSDTVTTSDANGVQEPPAVASVPTSRTVHKSLMPGVKRKKKTTVCRFVRK